MAVWEMDGTGFRSESNKKTRTMDYGNVLIGFAKTFLVEGGSILPSNVYYPTYQQNSGAQRIIQLRHPWTVLF